MWEGFEPATAQQIEQLKQLKVSFQPWITKHHAADLIVEFSATECQLDCLNRFGMKPKTTIPCREMHRLIGQEVQHRDTLELTPRQEQFPREHGRWRQGMTRGDAYDLIGEIKRNLPHGPW